MMTRHSGSGPRARTRSAGAAIALLLLPLLWLPPSLPQHAEYNPVARPDAVVVFGKARFTILTDRLIRLEAAASARADSVGDDRATSVVINRRFDVPKFTVSHPNATAVSITTSKLQLTYTTADAAAPGALDDSPSDENCGCSAVTGKCTSTSTNVSWPLLNNTQGADGTRTPGCPDGLVNQTLDSCFCACMEDVDCEGITYAPPGKDLALSCWLLMDVSKTIPVGDRIFTGALNGGPSKGFTDANLLIELLDDAAPVKVWRPSLNATGNLNGSYTNLDCYTLPESCAASNAAKMQEGLLSRDGWALWDDIKSHRMIPPPAGSSSTSQWKEWHEPNKRELTGSDLYFFGHGLDYSAALKDFLQLSGPPGMLSAYDYGLWWSNSYQFTKDEFLHRIISNFSKHKLPFTHLVMDDGCKQQPTFACTRPRTPPHAHVRMHTLTALGNESQGIKTNTVATGQATHGTLPSPSSATRLTYRTTSRACTRHPQTHLSAAQCHSRSICIQSEWSQRSFGTTSLSSSLGSTLTPIQRRSFRAVIRTQLGSRRSSTRFSMVLRTLVLTLGGQMGRAMVALMEAAGRTSTRTVRGFGSIASCVAM